MLLCCNIVPIRSLCKQPLPFVMCSVRSISRRCIARRIDIKTIPQSESQNVQVLAHKALMFAMTQHSQHPIICDKLTSTEMGRRYLYGWWSTTGRKTGVKIEPQWWRRSMHRSRLAWSANHDSVLGVGNRKCAAAAASNPKMNVCLSLLNFSNHAVGEGDPIMVGCWFGSNKLPP